MTLIRQTRNDHIVNSWGRVQLDQDYIARLQHRCHAVASYTKRDVFARRNVVRKLKPAITRLVPNLPALSRCDSQIEHRYTPFATGRSG